MAELMEYMLAFAVSVGVAGGGLVLYGGSSDGLERVALQVKADQIAAAARLVAAQGGASPKDIRLQLANTSLRCEDGAMTVSMNGAHGGGDATYRYSVDMPCSWDFRELTGRCDLAFSDREGSLTLAVAC